MNSLNFVIPVFNEEMRISKTIKALKKGFSFSGIKLEKIIFVDDGSTDKTTFLIKKARPSLEKVLGAQVKIISYKKNKGKGNAIRVGMLASDSDYTLFFDADMATPLSEFEKFLPFVKKGAPVIIGTRKNGKSTVRVHQPKYREVLGKGFTFLSNIILNTWVTDFTCGFKAFSREAKNEIFSKATIDRWGYDAEIMFLSRKLGYKIQERAVLWYDDNRTKVNLAKDLPNTFFELIRIRVNCLDLEFSFPRLKKLSIKNC